MRPPLLAALAAGLLAASPLSGWLAYRGAVAELDRALELRPPLAVLDYETITARLAQGTPAKELEPAFAGLKRWSSRLREHGYLVLNRAAADAVPEAYLVRPDPADLPAPAAPQPRQHHRPWQRPPLRLPRSRPPAPAPPSARARRAR